MMKCCRYDDGESVLATGSLERPGPAGDQLSALESAADPAPQPQPDPQLPPLPHYHGQRTTRLVVTEGPPSAHPACVSCCSAPAHFGQTEAWGRTTYEAPQSTCIATLNIHFRTEQAQG